MLRSLHYGWGVARIDVMVPAHTVRRLRRTMSLHPSFHPLRQSTNTTLDTLKELPQLRVPQLECSRQMRHVQIVAEKLASKGILKISLNFPDDDSRYLEKLVISLHKYHGHKLPISHSASRGWFWDIRPSTAKTQSAKHQARSETMEEFPWHTDCSYEDPPPRYFALQVLQPDRYGGGVLSLMNVQRLSERLYPNTRSGLMYSAYKITTPPEFKKEDKPDHITGALLSTDSEGRTVMRFRGDLISTPIPKGFIVDCYATCAVNDLKRELTAAAADPDATIRLSAEDLPARTILIVDNRRWLHARSDVRDPERHLRRIRWDAIPFPGTASKTSPADSQAGEVNWFARR